MSYDSDRDTFLEERRKQLGFSHADPAMMSVLPPLTPVVNPAQKGYSSIDRLESGAVSSVATLTETPKVHVGKGHNPYDSVALADQETETRLISPAALPAQNGIQGTVVFQKTGNMTARLLVSMEALFHMMGLNLSRPLTGRCAAIETVADQPEKRIEVESNEEIKTFTGRFIPMICQIVHTVLNTLREVFHKIWHAPDHIFPLIGRVTQVCITTCQEFCEECKEVATSAPQAFFRGVKSLLGDLKAWVFG